MVEEWGGKGKRRRKGRGKGKGCCIFLIHTALWGTGFGGREGKESEFIAVVWVWCDRPFTGCLRFTHEERNGDLAGYLFMLSHNECKPCA